MVVKNSDGLMVGARVARIIIYNIHEESRKVATVGCVTSKIPVGKSYWPA